MSAFLWHLHHAQSRAFPEVRSVNMEPHWHIMTISQSTFTKTWPFRVFHLLNHFINFIQFHPLQLRYSSDWPRCLPRPVWFAVSVHGPEVEVVAVQEEVSWGQWYHGIPPARRKLVEAQNRAPNLWLSWRWPKIKRSKKMLGKTLRLSEPWNKCIVICICKIVNCTYAWIFLLYELTCQSPINAICQRCETTNATHVSCWQTSICLRADQTYPNKTSKNISRKIMEDMEDPTQNIPKPSKLDNFAVLSKSQQIASKECRWLFHLPLVLVVFEPLCSVDRSWSCRSNCKMMWNYPCRACISWCACHGPNRIADSWNISWCDFTPSMAIRSISMKAERKSMEKRIHPKRIKKIHKVNKE